jgi:GntR family transcriptional regulator
MTPFWLKPLFQNASFDQVVYGATKDFVTGVFLAGQPFPSVRALASLLKVHPNTALKVVQHLIEEGFLSVRPGIGTIVQDSPAARTGDRKKVLLEEADRFVVKAKRVGLELPDILRAIETRWTKLSDPRRRGISSPR